MPTEPLEARVFGGDAPWLASRTLRALERLGVEAGLAVAQGARAGAPVWLVRAGAIPLAVPRVPPPSATGKPLVALGATVGDPAWRELVTRSGGDLDRAALPPIDSVLVMRPELLDAGVDEGLACASAVASGRARAVRLPALDVRYDARLRIALAVTTLHRGGAERVVLDLVSEMRGIGHDVLLAVLDRPSRSTYPAPEGTVQLHERARSRAERIHLLADLAIEHGADLVHVHLADGDEVRLLARSGMPVVVSVHNAKAGWPARLEPLGEADAALVVACSRDVAAELRASRVGAPVRVVWNGIVPRAIERKPSDALELLVVANHRPQKRLERIPGIVAALRRRGRDARAVLVGEPVRADPASLAVAEAVRAEAERLDVADAIELAGSREDLAPSYAEASVVVSTSAFEGLSLVHLEALSAGVPLVTTAVSGTSELAAKHPHVRVVDLEADAEAFADAILAVEPAPRAPLAPELTARRMAERHVELFQRAIAPPRRGGGLLLVTNNFATGGAQSSARRLLTSLDAAGVRVNAVVLEEQRDHPTKGRAALGDAGIAVHVAPRAGTVDPLVTARDVERLVDRIAPDVVVFWNAIPEHKVLIADRLLGVPVWDVSPGEMYFASFDRYFASPRASVPYLDTRDYGRLLAGAVVKYEAERTRAEEALGVRVSVIPNGVSVPSRPTRRDAPPAGALGVVVGTLARLGPDKKLEQLIDAARHGGFTLRIAGGVEDEDYAASLRARAEGAAITFVGEEDSDVFLGTLDVFAMISEPSGCPNASLEAMARGLPVVATDHGGVREQVVHGVTGLVVPRGDSTALGDAVAELARDPMRREKLGDAGHARAKERFSIERMTAAYARALLGVEID